MFYLTLYYDARKHKIKIFRKVSALFLQEEGWKTDFSIVTSYFEIHSCYQFWWKELKALVIICATLNQTLSRTKLWATLLMNIHRKTKKKKISCHENQRIYLFPPVWRPTILYQPYHLSLHQLNWTLVTNVSSTYAFQISALKFVLIKERVVSWRKKLRYIS